MSSHNRQHIYTLADQTDEQSYAMLYTKVGTGHRKNKLLQNHSSQQIVFYKTNVRRCFGSPIRWKDRCSTCVRQTSEFHWNEEGKQNSRIYQQVHCVTI